jgi:hypothetical protein
MASSYPPPETNYQDYAPVETNIWAIVSLVSGVLGWLGLFGLGGIAAVVAGHIAKNEIRRSAGRSGGEGLATAGLILGYTNIAITLAGICLVTLVIFGAISVPFLCLPFANQIQIH